MAKKCVCAPEMGDIGGYVGGIWGYVCAHAAPTPS